MPRVRSSLSDTQCAALEDLANGPLTQYRRGYAPARCGPFHSVRTIRALERAGLVAVSKAGLKARRLDVDSPGSDRAEAGPANGRSDND
ncbi:MAG: hypothetical protein ACR2PM_03425 [Hyphomicrobiales bacterium]